MRSQPLSTLNSSPQLENLFYPRSIAIVGASTSLLNFGSAFFTSALKDLGYKGKIYYINPKYEGEFINNQRVIASLDDVDEKIDVVYSCIRAKLVPDLLRQCVRRGDKFFICFTSGFSEIQTEDAIALEKELLSIIKGSSTRIIGPNCLGPYNPALGVGWNAGLSVPKREGNIAFASQSGGHATTLLRIAPGRGFYYTLGLSFGNQIDVNCLEVLEYYANHPETDVIAFYLEDTGSADGAEFFRKLREVTKKKPVVIWKGGQTETGARAAASHTGAISGSLEIWHSMTKQAGGIFVEHSEEFWDILHLLSVLIPYKKLQLCKRLGLVIPGGGNSVEATDLFTRFGFEVPVLSQETQDKIQSLIPAVNTSVKNPVDLGASGTIDRVFLSSLRYIAEDPSIDCVIHYQPIDWVVHSEMEFGGQGYSWSVARSLGRLAKNKLKKPLIQLMPIFEIEPKISEVYPKFIEILRKYGVPNFNSMIRLAKSLNHLNEYVEFHSKTE
ncbi:MAG: CoA-binding protein [Candidatus Helarchaeota archaeon]